MLFYRQQGVILVSFLLIFFVLTLLTMQALQSSQWAWKMRSNDYLVRQQQLAAEAGLLKIERELVAARLPLCIVTTQHNDYYIQQPEQWWLDAAVCRGKVSGFTVAAVVEELHTDPCVLLKDTLGQEVLGAQYWRVTVRSWAENSGALFLQSLVATQITGICDDEVFPAASVGRQAWRQK